MKKLNKLLMIATLVAMAINLVACGNSTVSTTDEAVSISGKVSTATAVEVAEVAETSEEYVAVSGYLEENATSFAFYDIKIADADGNAVQPEGAVEVKIQLPDSLREAKGDIAIFYVNGENFTKLEATEADGYVTFTTDHFSVYVVAKYETSSAIADLVAGEETKIPHSHRYEETVTVEVTCAENGTISFVCECGDSYTETVEALGHNYETVADSAVEPTCDTDGKNADTKCSICGETITGETIASVGHNFGDYVYNDDATTKKDGTETATCSICGGKDTRTKAGTKIAVSYDGYDEFGNGYVWGDDGYKHFDASCPYPINQIVDNGNEVYYYGIYGQPQKDSECAGILCDRYGIAVNDPRMHIEITRIGYYNGQLVMLGRRWVS